MTKHMTGTRKEWLAAPDGQVPKRRGHLDLEAGADDLARGRRAIHPERVDPTSVLSESSAAPSLGQPGSGACAWRLAKIPDSKASA